MNLSREKNMVVENLRVSRAERQALTRERLIEVARELFLTDGYATTSLDRVAVEAGFSKGAVYSNFAGKEELCLAVLDSIHGEQVEGVIAAFTADTNLDGRIEAFAEWARDGIGRPSWTALEVEFAAVARHSPFVATELTKRHRELLGAIEQLIVDVLRDEGAEVEPEVASRAAVTLLSLGIGLGALRSLDHSIDVGVFGDAMRALLTDVVG